MNQATGCRESPLRSTPGTDLLPSQINPQGSPHQHGETRNKKGESDVSVSLLRSDIPARMNQASQNDQAQCRDRHLWEPGDPRSGAVWEQRLDAGPPQGQTAPLGGSDPRSGAAWGQQLRLAR